MHIPFQPIVVGPIAWCFRGGYPLVWGVSLLVLLGDGQRVVAADDSAVGFDAPAIVVAEPVNPAVVERPTMGGDLLRLRIPVSTFVSSGFRGDVDEFVVEIESPYQTLRIVDFWPKSEMYSEIEGNVSVESSQQQDSRVSFKVSAAYEPIGRGAVEGDMHQQATTQERYQRKPPMHILTSSGTIHRGYGVFFKFRPGPLPMHEGVREVAILAEVPRGWRADMLQVSMRAMGRSRGSSRPESLGQTRLWTTTHLEGDTLAANQTRRYVAHERALRGLAAAQQSQIADKSFPTLFHKLGATLHAVEPKIPSDYLAQIIFGARNQYYDNAQTNRLPVDLRVAVLDYWDQRTALMQLATGQPTAHPTEPVASQVSYRRAAVRTN